MTQDDHTTTLKELLSRSRNKESPNEATVERYAAAGAEALAIQERASRWLTADETAKRLKLTPQGIEALVRQRSLPAAQTEDHESRFHRRDVGLYGLRHALGATESQVTPILPPAAWSVAERWGVDPYQELTPG